MSIPSATNDHPRYTEIDVGYDVYAVTFTANGEYLVSGTNDGVGVWRVRDGKQVAKMKMRFSAQCVAASKDGRWIAAGSDDGEVLVWDATTYEQLYKDKTGIPNTINLMHAVDFSPDSTRLAVASSNGMAIVVDIVARQRIQTLYHAATWVLVAKYSPRGDRIATASSDSIRVWDNQDGRSLVDVEIPVNPSYGLFWFNDHLFVATNDNKIKRIDASTGSTVSEWPVLPTGYTPRIALLRHGEHVACSTGNVIRFWNDNLLAIGTEKRRIAVTKLSSVKVPEIRIDSAALDSWKNGQLANAEALLTAEVQTTQSATHHVLASRALVKARLRVWDEAVADAEGSIKAQPSVMGYIAKCVALVGKGERDKECWVHDIAFQDFHSDHVSFLLLVKAVVLFMAGEHSDAISHIDDLIATVFFNSTLQIVQAHMYHILGSLHMESGDYEDAIQSFEHARVKLGDCTDRLPLLVSLISGWKFDKLATTTQRCFCEALFAAGRTTEARESALHLANQDVDMIESMTTWVSDFVQRCHQVPENIVNASGDAIIPHMLPETSHVSHPSLLSREWARSRLITGSWKDALTAAVGFTFPRITIYQVICELLEMTDQLGDAVACFLQMRNELGQEVEQASWTLDFQLRCRKKLEGRAETAMNAGQHDKAIAQYTLALSLNHTVRQDLLVKRSMAWARKRMWKDALDDANEVIKLDPSSPLGYERKSISLYGMRHGNTADTFETMLLQMSQSPNPDIREQSHHYIKPEQMKEAIRTTVEDVICVFLSVLIDVSSGRLCRKSEQASAFESTLAFMELVSTMSKSIDHARIEKEVREFYCYAAVFSLQQEANIPFQKVQKIGVYDLETSPAHEKLKMFCKIVREAGLNWAWRTTKKKKKKKKNWAWSDACCEDGAVPHLNIEWYERSAMTIIFLCGVDQLPLCRGAPPRSIWTARLWTLMVYNLSKVVRFYSEDWTPYLGLDIPNHKESPEIISEMEEATGLSTRALMAVRPGFNGIREKLRLASMQQTTAEDAMSAFIGVFPVSTRLPVGSDALGRLLAKLLRRSADTTILAWTGRSGSFNSLLPADIAVFNQPPTLHIPPPLADAETTAITATLRSLDLTLATKLYDQLSQLPAPSRCGPRVELPCIMFKLRVSRQKGPNLGFRAKASALGLVEIRSEEDLSRLGSLCPVHPWMNFLLGRQGYGPALGELPSFSALDDNTSTRTTQTTLPISCLRQLFARRSTPCYRSSGVSTKSDLQLSREKKQRVVEFIARLRKPFGALLLTSRPPIYRRVSAGSLITVQVEEITPLVLNKLISGVQVLNVL